jgi:hypothetical protein
MDLFDSFSASLTSAIGAGQASPEGQTKDYDNAMLNLSMGEPVEPLAQATFRGIVRCRWYETSIEVPILVCESRFIGFGQPTLRLLSRFLYLSVQTYCVTGTGARSSGGVSTTC